MTDTLIRRPETAIDVRETWVVAMTTAPTIVCPPWCTTSADDHLARLGDYEGRVIHFGTTGEGEEWGHLTTSATPDGAHVEGPAIMVDGDIPDCLTTGQARDLAAWLLRAADAIEEQ